MCVCVCDCLCSQNKLNERERELCQEIKHVLSKQIKKNNLFLFILNNKHTHT